MMIIRKQKKVYELQMEQTPNHGKLSGMRKGIANNNNKNKILMSVL
jgi:hypothetical protein